jgi:hypothetical protein
MPAAKGTKVRISGTKRASTIASGPFSAK